MKKLLLVSLMTTLTACSKPVTEVKKGESQKSGTTIEQPITSHLSTNNAADIQADIEKIQAFGMAQEKKAAPLEQRMEQAMQKQDQAALASLFNEFQTFVEQNNHELSALKLKSSEVNQLRGKMIESSLLGLEMSKELVTGSPENIDPAKLEPLQNKVMQTQQELMAISQDIHQKLQGQSAEPIANPTQATPAVTQ